MLESTSHDMNILVIVSDTFRRDNMATYGGLQEICPNLNTFAQQSLIFERFYACSFPTVPARADLLTGQAAFTRQGWGPLNQDWPTVAELATTAGYQTMCVTDVPFLLRSGYGYDRGFQDYVWVRGQPDRAYPQSSEDVKSTWRHERDHFVARTMNIASDWLERQVVRGLAQPFFLMVDTWDPHEPWDAPDYYVRQFVPTYAGQDIPYPPYQPTARLEQASEMIALGRAGYLGKARMVDFWIGYLLQRLVVLGLQDNTAVFFLTDHGFYFGEHGYFGKSVGWRIGPVSTERSAVGQMERSPLYEEVTHIPLVIKIPGWAPARVGGMASMPDVAATILTLMGITPTVITGRPLLDLVRRQTVSTRDFTVTAWPMHLPGETTQAVDAAMRRFDVFMPITITTEEWTLLYSSEFDAVELYHLRTDPKQTVEMSRERPDIVRELHGRLVDFLEKAQCPEPYLAPRRRLSLPGRDGQ